MRIHLLYFASFRDATGRQEEVRDLSNGLRVRDLWTALGREFPELGRFPSMPPAAVNREYVAGDTVLQEGDEVTFLPPVAGG